MAKATEPMYLKVTKKLGDEHQDLLVSLEAHPDGSYDLKKVIFWQKDLRNGKEAWAVMPLGENPEYEESMKEDLTAQIQKLKRTEEGRNPEYKKLINSCRKKMILQDEY